MKKKIRLLFCILLATICFVGCSNNKADTITDEQKTDMKSQCELIIELCSNTEAYFGVDREEFVDTIDSYSEFEMNSFIMSLNNFFSQNYGLSGVKIGTDEFLGVFNSWDAAVEECGKFEEVLGDFKVDEEKCTVSVEAKFKERNATILFTFDEDARLESMDVSAKFSMKEILTKAGLNTLLGMGIVFTVLIFLAFLISLMKYIPVLMGAVDKKEKQPESAPVVVDEEPVAKVEPVLETGAVEDDLELIAVITAAIAAQEGTSTNGFVVRSIRRRPLNNWK